MYTPFLIKLNKGQFHLLKYAFLNKMPYSKNDPVGISFPNEQEFFLYTSI